MAIAAGVIVAWPSTAGSIPDGWDRVTELDGRYVRGVADGATNPGATGGSATHTHTTASHTHSIDHTHASATSASAGSLDNSTTSASVSVANLHTHSFSAASSGGSSGAASPTTDAQSNDPANLTVIWVASDGTPDVIPAGALAMWHDSTLPSGWSLYSDAQNRFLKGAATSGNGGATSAGNVSHSHTANHTHTSDHTHSATSDTPSNTNTVRGFETEPFATTTHTHTVTFNSASGGTLPSESVNVSTGTNEPNYVKSAIVESPGDLPTGLIAIWRGTLAAIPDGWVLCDGNNGTPNLLGAFVKGANSTGEIGDTGGAAGHGHSGSSHTHSVAGSHTHSTTWGAQSATTGATTLTGGGAGAKAHSTAHNATSGSGSVGTSGSANPAVGTTSDTRPPFEDVAFIQYQVANTAPTADAGDDQEVEAGDTVQLDGTGSTDAEDSSDDLTYSWTVVDDGGTGTTTEDLFTDASGDAVLALSPVNFWRCDETSGTSLRNDGSASHTAALSGTYTLGDDFNGKSAVAFGGGYALSSQSPYVPGNQDTISVWAKIEPGQHEAFMTPVGAGSNTWDMRFDSTTQIRCHRVTTVTNRNLDITPPSAVDDGEWHHYCVVFDGTNGAMSVYFDGSLESSTTWTPGETPTALSSPLAIGASGTGGSRAFAGSIAQVATFSAALNDGQVQAIYEAGVSDETPGSSSATPKFVATLPTAVTIRAWGAQGGGAGGGLGGYAEGTFVLPVGTELGVFVGGEGADPVSNPSVPSDAANAQPGGFNGGGTGGYSWNGNPAGEERLGASGGGASDVRLGGSTLADRIVVGAGGGGAGSFGAISGGDGGGTTGEDGQQSSAHSIPGGGGGTQSAGGAGSSGAFNGADATDGALGVGGTGAVYIRNGWNPGPSGGGGGGLYGGGGGASGGDGANSGSGGGGGSSFIDSSAESSSTTSGQRSGHGRVEIQVGTSTTVFDYTGSPATYVVPPGPGAVESADVVLQLEVTDSGGLSDTDTVTITITEASLITYTAAGGVLVGGEATFGGNTVPIISKTGTGGVVVGGAATVTGTTEVAVVTGAGGVLVGGAASMNVETPQAASNIVVEWDFDNDGDFDEPEEDITRYVMSVETFTGRDWPSQLAGKAGPGKLRATLRNDDDRFSFFNGSSPLNSSPFSLKTGRKLRVRTTDASNPDPVLLARDRFRRSDGALGNEELGATWSGPLSDDFTIVSGQAAATGEGDPHMAVVNVGAANYYAQVANTEAGLETNVVGLVYRYQDTSNYSLCVVDVADAELQLINVVSGTPTTVASQAVEVYDRMTIGVLVSGSTVTAYLEGVPILSGTATQTDETEVGFYAEWGSGDNRPAFDDFFVWDGLPQKVEGILWTGDVSDLVSSVQAGPEKQASISGEGWLSRLAGQKVRPPASITGRKTGLLVGNTLSMARMLHPPGWIDEGDITTGPFGMEETDALDAIRHFEETELGFLYESQEGYLAYDARSARDGATSAAAFSDASGAKLGYHRLEPYDWRREVVNRVFAGVTPEVPSGVSVTSSSDHPFTPSRPLTVNMPGTVNAGDLLLVVISATKMEGIGNFAAPPTWQELASNNDLGQEYGSVLAYAKVADGSEGGATYVFGVAAEDVTNGGWAAQVYRVTDWFGELENGLSMGSYAGGSNSPVVFPSWGLHPSLFIAVRHGVRGDTSSFPDVDYPTGYGNGVTTSTGTGIPSEGAVVQSARRIAVAAVENPAAFGGTFGPFQLTASVVFAVRGPNGDPPLDNGNVTVMVDEVASQDDHNAIRTYRNASNLFASEANATTYANLVLERYADDRPILALSFYASKNAGYRAQAVRRRVGDKITLVANNNTGFGINADFFIESISHKWSHGTRLWETTWELSPA